MRKVRIISQLTLLVFILLFPVFQYLRSDHESTSASGQKGATQAAGLNSAMLYSEEELEYLDHSITNLLIENRFNGNVLISRYGMVIYQRSFGFSSFTRSEPMNLETTFQLASITKTFTSAAVLLLQHQGKLHIDDLVMEHIPEFPYPNITVRQMLNHTSGLQNYMWLVERHWRRKQIPSNEDVLQLFINHPRGLNFTPGNRLDYSNTVYVFLGLLIERVSGQSYREFIHQNIFDPLEMYRSYVYDLHQGVKPENRAFGYRQWRGRQIIIPDDNLDGPLGDKGIFSSVTDLYKWDQALHRSELIPAVLWQDAFAHARLNNNDSIDYGLGWRLQSFLDKEIVHHPGRWHGFRTSFKRFLNDHSLIVVLSNNNTGILPVIEGIQNIIYYEDKEIWLASNEESKEEYNDELPEDYPNQ